MLPKVRHEEPIGSIDLPHASLRGETPLAAPHSPQNAAQAMRTLPPQKNLTRKARDKRETTRGDPARDVLLVPDDYGQWRETNARHARHFRVFDPVSGARQTRDIRLMSPNAYSGPNSPIADSTRYCGANKRPHASRANTQSVNRRRSGQASSAVDLFRSANCV